MRWNVFCEQELCAEQSVGVIDHFLRKFKLSGLVDVMKSAVSILLGF